jgi:hypothetical protein
MMNTALFTLDILPGDVSGSGSGGGSNSSSSTYIVAKHGV